MTNSLMRTCFKQSMQKIGFPTMIITTSSYVDTLVQDFHGLAVSSITSLSVNPKPLLQFNVQVPSNSSRNLHLHDIFAVHQLKPESRSVDLIKRFSKGTKHGGTSPFVNLVENQHFSIYKNSLYDSGKSILPILRNVERVLICKKHKIFPIADHEVWVGEIIDCVVQDNITTGGLLHSNGHFYKLGSTIKA